MLNALHFIKRHTTSFFATAGISILSLNLFEPNAITGLAIMMTTYCATLVVTKQLQIRHVYQSNSLTRLEYKHIAEQINKAEQQINELNKTFLRVRSIQQFKQILNISRLARSIVNTIKKNPRKFYHVEPFFYAHLESATQLTKQCIMLSQQPIKDKEIQLAIAETRTTLEDLHQTIENDLKDALADDIEHLKMEIEFAKLTNEQQKQLK